MTDILEERKRTKETYGFDNEEQQIVVFRIGEEEFGVDIDCVEEIVRLPEITKIPKSPDYVLGLCNLRGNILAAIETRRKFNMDRKEIDDQTRMMIIEIGGQRSGLVIDSVSEVTRISRAAMENTPDIATNVDKAYIEGVITLNDGKRLVLLLNLFELVRSENYSMEERAHTPESRPTANETKETIEEEQFVTFKVAEEEYAFGIKIVQEILKVPDISKLPDAPEYIKGIITVRNKLIPVIDFRTFIGIDAVEHQYLEEFDNYTEKHQIWEKEIENLSVNNNDTFPSVALHECPFTNVLSDLEMINDAEIKRSIQPLQKIHQTLHEIVSEREPENRDHILDRFKQVRTAFRNQLKQTRESIVTSVRDEQKILVIENQGVVAGILVDSVNEVLRVESRFIDNTPMLTADNGNDLDGIAKLNEGKRLIMIMNSESVFTAKNKSLAVKLEETKTGADQAEVSMDDANSDEKQMVTFNIGEELYGLSVLQVQEINRIPSITKVPKAPHFVEGVVNLRGEILPVIDLRKIFEIESKEIDDRSRIIITDVSGKKTGIIVDKVNEVVRIPLSSIENAPDLITSSAQAEFIEGVGRLTDKEMIIIVQVENMLTTSEKEQFTKLHETDGIKNELPKERSEYDTELIDD